MKRVSVRANNCALCHDSIITDVHPATQGIVNVPALRADGEHTQSKASVADVVRTPVPGISKNDRAKGHLAKSVLCDS